MNVFKIAKLIAYVGLIEDVPEDIQQICTDIEQEFSAPPP